MTGSCCWELFSHSNYSGARVTVRPGVEYTSVTSLAHLFREVSSARRCGDQTDLHQIISGSSVRFSQDIVASLLIFWIIPRQLLY